MRGPFRRLTQWLEYVQSVVVASRRVKVTVSMRRLSHPRNVSLERWQGLHRSIIKHDCAVDREKAEVIRFAQD